jgi:hypothetical protein
VLQKLPPSRKECRKGIPFFPQGRGKNGIFYKMGSNAGNTGNEIDGSLVITGGISTTGSQDIGLGEENDLDFGIKEIFFHHHYLCFLKLD